MLFINGYMEIHLKSYKREVITMATNPNPTDAKNIFQ
jgi:hypothetical protein